MKNIAHKLVQSNRGSFYFGTDGLMLVMCLTYSNVTLECVRCAILIQGRSSLLQLGTGSTNKHIYIHYLPTCLWQDDLLSLKVVSVLHHLSIKRAIQVLRINNFEPNCLRRRPSDEVLLWDETLKISPLGIFLGVSDYSCSAPSSFLLHPISFCFDFGFLLLLLLFQIFILCHHHLEHHFLSSTCHSHTLMSPCQTSRSFCQPTAGWFGLVSDVLSGT